MTGFVHALPFGAGFDGRRTRFRVWAPSCRSLGVRIDGGNVTPLQAEDDGWFSTRIACPAGATYRYVLDDGTELADPASRAQPDGVAGPSRVVDPRGHDWQHADWRGRPWAEAVVYELHVGAFGGFNGVRAQLPRLAELGVTAIELMPVAQFAGERNWGYDGVLPYAPAACYGSPDELKALVDAAHGLGLMVLLDVVYNHFGPAGNVMPQLAAGFFRDDLDTPWGPAIDFRKPQVRDFFAHNVLYWLMEYRFDGLRLDAVHAISERDWLPELAATVRATVEAGRHVHLVLENEHNDADLLQRGFDAQWNDDAHHVLHVLLTGEHDGYYADYADQPTAGLARWLAEGFVFQGQPCGYRDGAPRGQPSAHLPTTAFVNCLQNHDQIGNRAFGKRLTVLAEPGALRAAMELLLLTPQIPMLFMGEEWSSTRPFLYFTDFSGELAEAVRKGRRREFARFPEFRDERLRQTIPDPNAVETFADSVPDFARLQTAEGQAQVDWIRKLLRVRAESIVPRLPGTRSIGAVVLGHAAVQARWRLGDGSVLSLLVNLDGGPLSCSAPVAGRVLHETAAGAADAVARGELPAQTLVAWLTAPDPAAA